MLTKISPIFEKKSFDSQNVSGWALVPPAAMYSITELIPHKLFYIHLTKRKQRPSFRQVYNFFFFMKNDDNNYNHVKTTVYGFSLIIIVM